VGGLVFSADLCELRVSASKEGRAFDAEAQRTRRTAEEIEENLLSVSVILARSLFSANLRDLRVSASMKRSAFDAEAQGTRSTAEKIEENLLSVSVILARVSSLRISATFASLRL